LALAAFLAAFIEQLRYYHPRTYLVQVEHLPTLAATAQLQQGVQVQDYTIRPAVVRLLGARLGTMPSPVGFWKTVLAAWLELPLIEDGIGRRSA
jgi:23S rRNA pseudouridine2457 synthase